MLIAHISDIRIQKKNYKIIIKCFKELKKVITPSTTIVLIGDIFLTKTYLTSQDISIFYTILELLLLYKIIICIGTRDINHFPSIIKQYPNVTLMYNTSVYTIDDINIYFLSFIDKTIPDIILDKPSICIMHEYVLSTPSVLIPTDTVLLKRFDTTFLSKAFDIVLLGGSNKMQFLSKTIAYSGSFVQYEQDAFEHGFIIWNTQTKEGMFYPIQNSDIDLVLTLNGSTNVDMPDVNVRSLTLRHIGCAKEYVEFICNKMIYKYGKLPDIIIDEFAINEFNIDKTYSISHSKFIKVKLNDNPNLSKILKLHSQYLKLYKITTEKWEIEELYWDNIMCYGKGNYINFTGLEGTTCITGNNRIGKSCIIDILAYILFNHIIRGDRKNLINSTSKNGFIRCTLKLTKMNLIIERKINKSTSITKLYLDEKLHISGTKKVYDFLSKTIGYPTLFLNLNIAMQNRILLPDMDTKMRKYFILSIIKLEWTLNLPNYNTLKLQYDKLKEDISNLSYNYKCTATIKNIEYMMQEVNKLQNEQKKKELLCNLKECREKLKSLAHTGYLLKIPEEVYETYINLFDMKTGISSMIFKSIINLIINHSNKILSLITDFRINFVYSSIKGFEIYILYNNTSTLASMASGYQKFIIDLVLRLVFINILELGSELLILDEGFDCSDSTNFYSIVKMLIILKKKFKNIIITHNTELQSYSDNYINIYESEGKSIVNKESLITSL